MHTACRIQLHEEGIKKHAEEKLLTVLLANFYPQRSARDGPLPPPPLLLRVFDMLQYFETILP